LAGRDGSLVLLLEELELTEAVTGSLFLLQPGRFHYKFDKRKAGSGDVDSILLQCLPLKSAAVTAEISECSVRCRLF